MPEEADDEHFGAVLRRLRTQGPGGRVPLSDLADRVGYSVSHLSNIELGRKKPTAKLAERLDQELGGHGVLHAAYQRQTGLPGQRADVCPYRGLEPFRAADASWFFGRENAADTLVDRVRRTAQAGGGTVILLGASGAGKTSLLQAGLVPRISEAAPARDAQAAPVRPVVVTPTAHPLHTLARALAEPLGRPAAEVEEQLAQGCFPAGGEGLLLVVDQGEEVFTLCADEEERNTYLTAVCAAPLTVLALRADFYEHCLAYRPLARALEDATVTLGAMSRRELLRTVRRPAELARLQVEPELVQRLLEDLDPTGRGWEPSSLPLLSHALLTTWQQRSGRQLALRGYVAGGGLRGAITESAEAVYQGLSAAQRETARHLMLQLVRVGEENGDTRRRMPLAQLNAQQRAVAEAFIVARLLTSGDRMLELSHEAVLWAWPRLAGWIDADRAGLRLRQRIAEGAAAWQETGRREELLLQGAALAVAGQWAADHPGRLTGTEEEFLAESQYSAGRGLRRLRRLLRGLAGVTALAVLATVAAVAAVGREQDATRLAQAGQAAAAAQRLLASDPARAAALALAAHRYAPASAPAREAVAATSGFPVPRALAAGPGSVQAIALSHGLGRPALLATGTDDGTLTLRWAHEPDTRRPSPGQSHGASTRPSPSNPAHGRGLPLPSPRPDWARRVPGPVGRVPVYGMAFTNDGNTLVVAEGTRIRLWHVRYGLRPSAMPAQILWKGGRYGVSDLRLSRDGHTLAATSLDGHVLLWDVDDHRPVHRSPHRLLLPDPSLDRLPDTARPPAGPDHARPYAVSFSRDGTRLSAAGTHRAGERDTGVAAVWERRHGTGATGFTWRGALRLATSSPEAPLSPDGRWLAAGTGDGGLMLCPVSRLTDQFTCKGARRAPLLGAYAAGMAYSPDGRLLAEADHSGQVRLRAPHTGRLLLTLPHPGELSSLAFAPDTSTLFTGAAYSGTLHVWPLPLPALLGHTKPVHASARPADGQWLATADPHTVRLWRPGAGSSRPLTRLQPPRPGAVTALAASRDGTRLAVATEDWTVYLYDTTRPSDPRPLGAAGTFSRLRPVYAVALSHDGSLVAFGDDTKTVQLWNVPPAPGADQPTRRGNRTAAAQFGGGFFQSLDFSPDGTQLAGGTSSGGLHLWQARRPGTHRATAARAGHTLGVTAVSYLRAGTGHDRLATGDQQGRVRLWGIADPPTGAHTAADDHHVLWPLGRPVDLHARAVTALTTTPDGTMAASASADGTATLWPTDSDHPLPTHRIQAPSETFASAHLTPDSLLWTTGSAAVRRWHTSFESAEERLCHLLGDARLGRGDQALLPEARETPVCRN
ncbi:nSTAND1 domain-containing NTPase [Streptomyces umbrinus]|uniref:nSTAND1 domain-containing NTPase n=1 Tax=Streptomyces umbrinus TaxID=67370 RepID=UPI0033E6F5E3